MKVSKTLVSAMLLVAVTSAIFVNAYVIQKFPVTIQVSVREPLVTMGPTPANGTLFASSSKNFTLTLKNAGGPVSSILYFVTNASGWNCPACGYNTQPFTTTMASQVIAPAQDGGGGSFCGAGAVGDSRCSLNLTVPSGTSTVLAILTSGSNAPIINFTINFFLGR